MAIKKTFGPGGSSFSRRDTSSHHVPKIDPDLGWNYRKQFKIPPIRIPHDITKEEFLEALRNQEDEKKILSREDFFTLYQNPDAHEVRKARTRIERIVAYLEYAKNIEDYWWVNQQMEILKFIDGHNLQGKIQAYDLWLKEVFMPKVKAAMKMMKKESPKLIPEFLEAAADYVDSHRPQKKKEGSMMIINQIRKMYLNDDYIALRDFTRELGPFFESRKGSEE